MSVYNVRVSSTQILCNKSSIRKANNNLQKHTTQKRNNHMMVTIITSLS